MIHTQARAAVGIILENGVLKGHCVFIADGIAVTCTHVLPSKSRYPSQGVQVYLPAHNEQITAQVIALQPYKGGAFKGTDIALLRVKEGFRVPDYVPLETSSKARARDDSVLLRFLGIGDPGNTIACAIKDSSGNFIVIEGADKIIKGDSGTGVFYRDYGSNLLGIVVAAQGNVTSSTSVYAIPASEIALFLNDVMKRVKTGGAAKFLQIFFAEVTKLTSVGNSWGNIKAIIEPLIEGAKSTLAVDECDWRVDEVDAIALLYEALTDLISMDQAPSLAAIPSVLQEIAAQQNLDRVDSGAYPVLPGEKINVDDPTKRLLQQARSKTQECLSEKFLPPDALQALTNLDNALFLAISSGKFIPRDLSRRADLVARRVQLRFDFGLRLILFAIGRRADLAQPGTIFLDSHEDWAPQMVVIPLPDNRDFMMGSPDTEIHRDKDERQILAPIKKPYAMARYPITFGQFRAYCRAAGRLFPPELESIVHKDRDNLPATYVSWNDAAMWCRWISAETGDLDYRLPTEPEWEYACRADQSGRNTTPYSPSVAKKGKGLSIEADEANCSSEIYVQDAPKRVANGGVAPVNRIGYGPNAFGMFQMHGNIDEWCFEIYEEDYSNILALGLEVHHKTTKTDGLRVVRGGNYTNSSNSLRSAFRCNDAEDDRTETIGFRPIRRFDVA